MPTWQTQSNYWCDPFNEAQYFEHNEEMLSAQGLVFGQSDRHMFRSCEGDRAIQQTVKSQLRSLVDKKICLRDQETYTRTGKQ